MSVHQGHVISLILLERFGPVIEKVGMFLFEHGSCSLFNINKYVELPLSKVCIVFKFYFTYKLL